MDYTRDELIAEAKRRGLKIPDYEVPVKQEEENPYTRDELVAEARRRGLSIPEQESTWRPPENKFMSHVSGLNTKFDRVFHGILQPLLESGTFGQRVAESSKNVAKEREHRYAKSKRTNPLSTASGALAGELAMDIPALIATRGKAGTGSFAKILNSALGGAITEGVKGAGEYNEGKPGEAGRLEKGLKQGALGALLGGGGQAVGEVIKGGVKKYGAEGIAKKILETKATQQATHGAEYNRIFKQAEESGVNALQKPKINIKEITKSSSPKESVYLEKFLEEPTFKNAHKAQSDLGKFTRRMEKLSETPGGLTTSQNKAWRSALDAQKRIRGSMAQGLQKAKRPDLIKQYLNVSEGYKNKVLPYTKNKLINKHARGESTAGDFIKGLNKQELFRAQLAKQHPEVGVNRLLKNTLATGAGVGATALTGKYLLGPLLGH